jgi:hypothetical protein
MEPLLFLILIAFVLALAINTMLPAEQPPPIVYVQTEIPSRSGLGCLPLITVGILLLALWYLA